MWEMEIAIEILFSWQSMSWALGAYHGLMQDCSGSFSRVSIMCGLPVVG